MNCRQAGVCGFGLVAVSVLFLALVPGSLGEVIENGILRHALAFGTLAVMARTSWPHLHAFKVWFALAAFGGAIELLQGWMALGREADWFDWFNDMGATTIALAVVSIGTPIVWTRLVRSVERLA